LLFFRAPDHDKGAGVGFCFHRPETHCRSQGLGATLVPWIVKRRTIEAEN
jgi:hypothetical protein